MRIAVLLGGCGHYDGTDAAEATFVLLSLERAGERPVLLAPDVPQFRSVDHLSGDGTENETRFVLRESARIARSTVRPLSAQRPEDLDAIIIPGGYGPVLNFCSGFAEPGTKPALRPEIASFLGHFLESRKPIGLVSLGDVPVRILLGQGMDGQPPPAEPRELTIDRGGRIVHTPGFTAFTRLEDVRAGIEAMVSEVLRLMSERAAIERGVGTQP